MLEPSAALYCEDFMGLKSIARCALVLLLSSLSSAQSARQIRIVRPVDNRNVVRLQGSLSPRARAEFDRGPAPDATPMQQATMIFSRTPAQQADLDHFLAEQQDRNSPNYHKWLTPEEYGDRFGLAGQDVNVIAAWLQSQGFTVDEIARSRTWISFSGIAAQFDAAFHTSIHNYVVDGKTHYAPSADPSIPDAFAGVVAAVSGMHDFRPQPKSYALKVSPHLTSNLSGNHYLAPGDFGTIYNLPDYVQGGFQPGNDGSGQSIAVVGQTQLVGSPNGPYTDINTFRSVSSLPPINLQAILAGSDPGLSSGDIEEANLDIQWSGAVAPNATIFYVYSNNALLTSLQYIVNHNLAPVISISYGECEPQAPQADISAVESYLQQANAQGQTVTAASGDVGAADCDGTAQNPATIATHGLAVDYPASSVYVTAMGGTSFNADSAVTVTNGVAPANEYWNSSSDPNDMSASAFAYIPESVWNDTSTSGANVATGGGVSKKFGKPTWQTGNGVPQDGHRDVPDLALNSSPSHDGFIICSQGSCQTGYRRNSDQTFTVIGGTSAASPAFAGIVALANQKLGGRQGNLNPQIYSLAGSAAWAFNDITSGDNKVNCQQNSPDCPQLGGMGFSASPGYDLATGWGSIDASGFLNALAGQPAQPDFVLLPSVRVVTTSSTLSPLVQVDVNPKQGFAGSVTLSCNASSTLPGVTCAFLNQTLTVPGSATLHIVPSQDPTILGTQTGTATIQGISGSLFHAVPLSVTINYPDFQISAGNASESVQPGGTTTDTVTLTSVGLFAGTVDFTCAGTTGLTCSLNPSSLTGNLAAPVTTTLSVTASSAAQSGSITITATSSTLTHTLQLPVNVVIPDFTVSSSPAALSISSGQSSSATITVAPSNGFASDVALACIVSSSLGATTCSLSPTTVTGGNGTSTLTVRAAVLSMDRAEPLPFQHRGIGTYATLVFALGMVFTMKPGRGPSARARRSRLLGLLLVCVMLGAVSCGGGGGGGGTSSANRTPLSGTVTVTGTGGPFTHSVAIPVTVQ